MPSTPSPSPEAEPRGASYDDEISLLEVFNLVLRHRYRIAGTALLVGLLGALLALLGGRTYSASTSFVPQSPDAQQSRLATLAGQFGVTVPGSDGSGESPAFYAELLRSREILRPVARARYDFTGPGRGLAAGERRSGTLPELLELDEDTDDLAVLKAVTWLREGAVTVQTGRETGVVSLAVETPWAGLSYAIAGRMLELVNEFNLETRQSRAAAERQFLEGRLREARDSLLAAETRLEQFLQGNRQWEGSAELRFQYDRLDRQVTRSQQLATSLDQAYEEARVSEVRNTPVITVVESPDLPLEAEPRGLLLKTALGLLLGGMLGLFAAFGREMLRRERDEGSDTYTEFSELWKRTWYDVRTLGGRL
jgi:uncharacterized protein involved in exopolysaccharide biosynthesis